MRLFFMASNIERSYGRLLKYMYFVANPLKRAVLDTECQIHKFINIVALEILKNDNFVDAHNFFSDFILSLNKGAVWADQDFKSSGHFYSPSRERGLYGNKDALSLAVEYYSNAINSWHLLDYDKSFFYLGATVHLVQDMTIPQHANIRLMDSHRQFENFIKRTYQNTPEYVAWKGGYYVDSIEDAIKCNARVAIRIYSKLKDIIDDDKRHYTISKFTLPLAEKTTAGCFLKFYKDIARKKL
jgi:phospholipase C